MPRPRAFDEPVALQKALETFWRRGYAATSIEDLVAGTGLNRASLYATFGDKRQLFLRALRCYQRQGEETLTALTADEDAPALDHVRRVLELTVDLVRADDRGRGCFLVNTTTELAPHDPDARAVIGENRDFLEALLTRVLARGQARGEVRRSATPLAQARFLASVLNGMRVVATADPDPQAMRDVVETTLQGLAEAAR